MNRCDDLVAKAIHVLLSQPEADQTAALAALESKGVTPREAWRLYQFLPIAFFHVIMRGKGVVFEPHYIAVNPITLDHTQHKFVDEPLYIAGVNAAEQMIAIEQSPQDLFPIYGRSAEYHTLLQLLPPDGDPMGIGFVEPILYDYEK